MAKVLALSGIIHSKFESEAQMADALGWSRQRLNRITSGKQGPNLGDVQAIASVLNVSFMDVARIFLQIESPNGEKAEGA